MSVLAMIDNEEEIQVSPEVKAIEDMIESTRGICLRVPLTLLGWEYKSQVGKKVLHEVGFDVNPESKFCVTEGYIAWAGRPYYGKYILGMERRDKDWMKSGRATDKREINSSAAYESRDEDDDYSDESLLKDRSDIKVYSNEQMEERDRDLNSEDEE